MSQNVSENEGVSTETQARSLATLILTLKCIYKSNICKLAA